MKNRKISAPVLALAVIVLIGLSSCNRGYGCPYDFSILDSVSLLVKTCLTLLTYLF